MAKKTEAVDTSTSIRNSKSVKSVRNEDNSKESITSFDVFVGRKKKCKIYRRLTSAADNKQNLEWYKTKSGKKYKSPYLLIEAMGLEPIK